jgi:hypothetical protein
VLGAWSWYVRTPSVTIRGADIRGEKSVTIEGNCSSSFSCTVPYSLSVHIYGNLDGQALITDPWLNSRAIGPGNFDFILAGNYQLEEANFKYSSKTAKAGHVTIGCAFETIEL